MLGFWTHALGMDGLVCRIQSTVFRVLGLGVEDWGLGLCSFRLGV